MTKETIDKLDNLLRSIIRGGMDGHIVRDEWYQSALKDLEQSEKKPEPELAGLIFTYEYHTMVLRSNMIVTGVSVFRLADNVGWMVSQCLTVQSAIVLAKHYGATFIEVK